MEVVGKVITIISQYPGNFIPIVISIILFLFIISLWDMESKPSNSMCVFYPIACQGL